MVRRSWPMWVVPAHCPTCPTPRWLSGDSFWAIPSPGGNPDEVTEPHPLPSLSWMLLPAMSAKTSRMRHSTPPGRTLHRPQGAGRAGRRCPRWCFAAYPGNGCRHGRADVQSMLSSEPRYSISPRASGKTRFKALKVAPRPGILARIPWGTLSHRFTAAHLARGNVDDGNYASPMVAPSFASTPLRCHGR